MKLIVMTPDRPVANEAEIISSMLRAGVWRVHLRKPGVDCRSIVEAISPRWHSRLSIHDDFELTEEFPDLGVHLNSRNPVPPRGFTGVVSRSCHSVYEVGIWAPRCRYVTLSPIFPSISKPGYQGNFTPEQLQSLPPGKVIALGGVDGERIAELKRYPFAGAAVLGAVWRDADPVEKIKSLLSL